MEIVKEEDRIKLKQEEYARKILKQFEMEKAKPVKRRLILKNEERKTPKKKDFNYKEAIGSLLYLSIKTRYKFWSRLQ